MVNHLAKFFERLAQGVGRTRTGFALAFAGLGFELREHLAHFGIGRLAHFRVHGWLGWLGGGHRCAALRANFFCPHAHAGQRRIGVLRRHRGLLHRDLKSLPNHQQLGAGRVQQGGELQIGAGPASVGHQLRGLRLPVRHVQTQRF